jgi:hypothetical protein
MYPTKPHYPLLCCSMSGVALLLLHFSPLSPIFFCFVLVCPCPLLSYTIAANSSSWHFECFFLALFWICSYCSSCTKHVRHRSAGLYCFSISRFALLYAGLMRCSAPCCYVLFCSVLYWFVLLYRDALCRTVLQCIEWHCTTPCRAVLCYIILVCVALHCSKRCGKCCIRCIALHCIPKNIVAMSPELLLLICSGLLCSLLTCPVLWSSIRRLICYAPLYTALSLFTLFNSVPLLLSFRCYFFSFSDRRVCAAARRNINCRTSSNVRADLSLISSPSYILSATLALDHLHSPNTLLVDQSYYMLSHHITSHLVRSHHPHSHLSLSLRWCRRGVYFNSSHSGVNTRS